MYKPRACYKGRHLVHRDRFGIDKPSNNLLGELHTWVQLDTFGTLGTLVSLSTKCTQANFDRAEHGRRVHRVSALCTVRALCTDRAPKASES